MKMKNRIVDYKVCNGETHEELEKSIKSAKQEGWVLNGYSIESPSGKGFVQVMAKYNLNYPD